MSTKIRASVTSGNNNAFHKALSKIKALETKNKELKKKLKATESALRELKKKEMEFSSKNSSLDSPKNLKQKKKSCFKENSSNFKRSFYPFLPRLKLLCEGLEISYT
jgi:hypothetical protein